MKVGAYYGPGDIRVEERPVPTPSAGEVLVKVTACGLCGTDLHKYAHRTVPDGTVLGHEVVGKVAAVGSGISHVQPGCRVVVFHHIPCFVCGYCRRGNHSMCAAFRPVNIAPGGFSEYVLVSGASAVRGILEIPDHASDRQAAVVELAACCLRAILRCRIEPGVRVAVVGCGPVGLVHILLVKALGAGPVVGVDVVPERLDAVRRFGAIPVDASSGELATEVRRVLRGELPQVVVLAVGNARAIQTGLEIADKGAVISFFAECAPGTQMALDPNLLYHKELTLAGSYSSSPFEQRMALDLVSAGRVDFSELVTDVFPLDRLQEAFDLALRPGRSLKIVITNP